MKKSISRALVIAAAPVLFVALGAGTALARPASGSPPPPKGFEADAVSFVTAKTGFVLGARGCSILPCDARAEKTVNGGKAWTKVSTPAVKLVPTFTSSPASAVSGVTFATSSDGWLFGPALWSTTDGGSRWHRITLPGAVIAMAASPTVALAAVEPAEGGLLNAKLYLSQVGSGKWRLVKGVSPDNALTISGKSIWAGIAPQLWTSTDNGKHWTKLSFKCQKPDISASQVAAASPKDIAIACSNQGYPQPGFSQKEVFTSSNGGKTFRKQGQPPEPGQVYELVMPPGKPKIITMASASGASYLYQSFNGGKTWGSTTYFDGGLNFRDLAYASGTTGYVVHYNGGPVIAYTDGLLKTINSGKTWKKVALP